MKVGKLILGIVLVVFGALSLVEAMGFVKLDWSWLSQLDKYIVPILLLVIGAKVVESSGFSYKDKDEEKK